MKKNVLIAGLVLIALGISVSAMPVKTSYQVAVEVPYQGAVPEYKDCLVGYIHMLTGTVQIGPEHRIVDYSIEDGAAFKNIMSKSR